LSSLTRELRLATQISVCQSIFSLSQANILLVKRHLSAAVQPQKPVDTVTQSTDGGAVGCRDRSNEIARDVDSPTTSDLCHRQRPPNTRHWINASSSQCIHPSD